MNLLLLHTTIAWGDKPIIFYFLNEGVNMKQDLFWIVIVELEMFNVILEI